MSKKLVLTEKPSVARDIARVLKCNKKGDGYLEGADYIITWALGHLVELAGPESYGENYKTWSMDHLPIIPEQFKLEVIKKTSKQYKAVKSQLARKDVDEIIIATDAGREGELVARWIIAKAHVNKPIKRLWISSVTDKAIQEGFKNLKNGKEYENLYQSAVARAEADWVIGINGTRALTCKYNAQLSCGRVQTPTLAMVLMRENEIKKFKPKQYYSLEVEAEKMNFSWLNSKGKDNRIFDKKILDELTSSLSHKKMIIDYVKSVHKKTYSPQLYDLTELQRDANKLFDYSPKETLSIAQRLYENHKILTYPRTDSRYLSTDMVDTLKDRIKACSVGEYSPYVAKLLKRKITSSPTFVDNSKVTDHHAIIPTEEGVYLNDLSLKERNIYDLVVRRFFAVLYPPFEYEEITINAKINEEVFLSKVIHVTSQGFREIDGYDSDEISIPTSIKKGYTFASYKVKVKENETKPPAYFNEATLLSAMEKPHHFMTISNASFAKTLGNTGGIGTVATRADILEKLFDSFLIEKNKKDIRTTSKGRQLLSLVPEKLKSPELTAIWEEKLAQISKGTLRQEVFTNEMKEYSRFIVHEIKNKDEKFTHDNLTKNKCPDCGKFMLEVKSKNGTMLICQDRQCGSRKTVSRTTNARCPNCHKKLELRGEGENQIFTCSCGHREKLSSFTSRKTESKKQPHKRDVAQYLQNQKKNQEPLNTAFADALAKLKLKD